MWGQAVLTSVIEEKTSRVVEVMASGVPSTTLLLGKLLGVGSAGLTQFLVWALSLFAVSLASAGAIGGFAMPEITPLMLVSFVVFFLLGFFFYASLYAAIGASVNTVQEAQGLVFPVMLPIILAMVCWPAVLAGPGRAARGHRLDDPAACRRSSCSCASWCSRRRCGRSCSRSRCSCSGSSASSGSRRASTASAS